MKVAIITAEYPFGRGEAFLTDELVHLLKVENLYLFLVPRSPKKTVFHRVPEDLVKRTLRYGLLSIRYIGSCARLLCEAEVRRTLMDVVRNSRTLRILIKNIIIIPKSLFLVEWARREGIQHVHAHWGATTATIAYTMARICSLPWSLTLHRWDIKENNMLQEKIDKASFVRCISASGMQMLSEATGSGYEQKVHILHMGVDVPESVPALPYRPQLEILCPANLLAVKGHIYLLRACSRLAEMGVGFRCTIAGTGPLADALLIEAEELGLQKHVHFIGMLSREDIIGKYQRRNVDLVVLPSIVTRNGEHEGIPVALMEAMAYGVPTISTATGGIPELIGDGAGVLIAPQDSEALAMEISRFYLNRSLLRIVGDSGREKVLREFNVHQTTACLAELFNGTHIGGEEAAL